MRDCAPGRNLPVLVVACFRKVERASIILLSYIRNAGYWQEIIYHLWMALTLEQKKKRAAYAREYRKLHPGDKRKGTRGQYSASYRQTESYRTAQNKYKTSAHAKERIYIYDVSVRERDREKRRARDAVKMAKRKGLLTPSINCEKCKKPSKTQAHHTDYSKRLLVVWLCPSCHYYEDRRAA